MYNKHEGGGHMVYEEFDFRQALGTVAYDAWEQIIQHIMTNYEVEKQVVPGLTNESYCLSFTHKDRKLCTMSVQQYKFRLNIDLTKQEFLQFEKKINSFSVDIQKAVMQADNFRGGKHLSLVAYDNAKIQEFYRLLALKQFPKLSS